jgi:hypothetical protein
MSEHIHSSRGVTTEANQKHWTADAKASNADHAQVGTSQHTQKVEPNQSVTAITSWQDTLNSSDIMHVFYRDSAVQQFSAHVFTMKP